LHLPFWLVRWFLRRQLENTTSMVITTRSTNSKFRESRDPATRRVFVRLRFGFAVEIGVEMPAAGC